MTDYEKYNRIDFDFGDSHGHLKCLRQEILKYMPEDKVATLSDDMIKDEFLNLGFIPVKVSLQNEDENIYLIPSTILDNAICLYR